MNPLGTTTYLATIKFTHERLPPFYPPQARGEQTENIISIV